VSQLKQPVYFLPVPKTKLWNPSMSDIWQAFTPVSSLWRQWLKFPIVDTWQMVEQPDTVVTLIRSILAQHE